MGWQRFVSCLLLLSASIMFSQSQCYCQSPCASETETWETILVQLREAVEDAEKIKQRSVAETIRERITMPDRKRSIAAEIGSILAQKKQQIAQYQSKCSVIAEQEKIAYQKLTRCVASAGGRRDPSLNVRVKELTRQRETVMRDLIYVMTDEAYIQYLNQRPAPQDDSSNYRSGPHPWYAHYRGNH